MSFFKHSILFFLIGFSLIFFASLLLGNPILSIVTNISLWVLPALFSIIGAFIGVGVFKISTRPIGDKKRVFLLIQSICVLCYIIPFTIIQIKKWNYEKNYANIDANHFKMSEFIKNEEQFLVIAFKRLEKEFRSPNDFRLTYFIIREQNTLVNTVKEKTYNVYFTYLLDDDVSKKKYLSKISVLCGVPSLQLYNENPTTNEEYLKIMKEEKEMERDFFQTLNESFREMPDTTKNRLMDSIENIFKE